MTTKCLSANLLLPASNYQQARILLEDAFAQQGAPIASTADTPAFLARWFTLAPADGDTDGLLVTGARPDAYEELDRIIIPTIGHLLVRAAEGQAPSMDWEVDGQQVRWQLFGKHRVVSELVQIWKVRSLN